MESVCGHVASGTRIQRVDLDMLKYYTRNATNGHAVVASTSQDHRGRVPKIQSNDSLESHWNCIECGTDVSPWICLACGLVHCGRYLNQDGLRHYNRNPDHAVCMDCHSFALFCYICDDYVVGSDLAERRIHTVRESLRYLMDVRQGDHAYFDPALHCVPSAHPVSRSLKGGHQALPRQLKDPKGVGPVGRKPTVISRPLERNPAAPSSTASSPAQTTQRKQKRKNSKPPPAPKVKAKPRRLNPEEVVLGIRGLRNLGNTCFMNAVLQSLNNIRDFAFHVKQLPEKAFPSLASSAPTGVSSVRTRRSTPEQVYLASELRKTLWALEEAGSGAISPDALFSVVWKLVPRFRGFQQQDAHEFLRCILERLGTELGGLENASPDSDGAVQPSNGSESLVSSLFQGVLTSRVTCARCSTSSWKLDPFLDLSLDLPLGQDGKSGEPSLEACLERFFAPEDLEGREQALCEVCREKTPSTKQFFLRRLPDVLCLHLKRFRWQSGRHKLDHFVQFPVQAPALNLRPFLLPAGLKESEGMGAETGNHPEESEYHLAAVVVHHGSGAGSGHYTAYGQRKASENADDPATWYHFNDSSVRRSSVEMVRQQKAYLLFYVRNK